MNELLGCRFLPPPKHGGAFTTTSPAAPAAFALIYMQVLWRQRMAIAASIWYRERTVFDRQVDAGLGEADHFGFGCFKARPRYQFSSMTAGLLPVVPIKTTLDLRPAAHLPGSAPRDF